MHCDVTLTPQSAVVLDNSVKVLVDRIIYILQKPLQTAWHDPICDRSERAWNDNPYFSKED